MTTPTTTCSCGHAHRIHGDQDAPGCRACTCSGFTPATTTQQAAEATETARSAGEHRERAYAALRRAVANYRLDEARHLIDQLQEGTN